MTLPLRTTTRTEACKKPIPSNVDGGRHRSRRRNFFVIMEVLIGCNILYKRHRKEL